MSARNYSLRFTPGSFTVNKKQATIEVTNYNEWKAYTYDGKSPEIEAAVEGERTVKVEIYAGNPASGSALAEIPKMWEPIPLNLQRRRQPITEQRKSVFRLTLYREN